MLVKDLIQRIIKEYVGEAMPDFLVPKSKKLPSTDTDEQEREVQDKYFRVSKVEENQALNFIRSRFMDYGVGLFKSQYSHRLASKGEQRDLSVDVVNKRLRKISEDKFPGQRKKDVIQYSAPLIKSFNLTVNIFKNEDGELAIGYNNPLMKSVKFFLVHGPEHLTPMYEADAPKPKAGFDDKGVPQWSPAELYKHFFIISKIEEDKALDYIKREIVPLTVEGYNKYADKSNRIDVRNVQANLKKVRQGPYRINHGNGKIIRHDITIWKAPGFFTFFIFKQYAGSLFIGASHSLSAFPRVYKAFSNPPFKTTFNLPQEILKDPIFLTEGVQEIDWHLTKIEEQKALQFIRNSLLEQVVEDYNEAAPERKVPVVHYGPEERDIIDSLRKVKHIEFPEHKTDQIIYVADFKGWQWVFIIEKIGIGTRIPYIQAGYIDDRWNESKMYNINIPRPDDATKPWQDPKKTFKRVTGFMPHMPGGYPGLLGLKKPKLEEGFGQHDLTMSKREEDFGFHLLKQTLYDERAKKTIKKISHIRTTSPRHVPDKVVYEVIYSDNTVAWYAMGKNCRTGKLVYYPVDKDGERTTHHDTPLEDDGDPGLIESSQTPNLHISKEEETWALQQLRKRRNSQGESIGKYLKKMSHVVSNEPNRLSDRIKYKNTDDATTYTIVKNRVDGKLGYHAGYIAFKTDSRGRRLPDDWESDNIDDFEVPLHETKRGEINPVLEKRDEARAVQFIKGITDSGVKPYSQTLRKICNQPTTNEEVISNKAIYRGNLPNGDVMTFTVYMSYRMGLVVKDEVNCLTYKLDDPDPYGSPFKKTSLVENKIDPVFVISKKEEAEAFTWLSNVTEKGERFGKTIKKAFDGEDDGKHVIKYLVNVGGGTGVFSISKNQAGWIIIRSNFGSVMHIIKRHPYGPETFGV